MDRKEYFKEKLNRINKEAREESILICGKEAIDELDRVTKEVWQTLAEINPEPFGESSIDECVENPEMILDKLSKYESFSVEGKVYEDFIEYALKTSDAFMFLADREYVGEESCNDEMTFEILAENLELCVSFAKSENLPLKTVFMDFLRDQEIGVISNGCKSVMKKLEPFLIKTRKSDPGDGSEYHKIQEEYRKQEEKEMSALKECLDSNDDDGYNKLFNEFADLNQKNSEGQSDYYRQNGIGWPGNLGYGDPNWENEVRLYKSDISLLPHLLKPGSLENWRMPKYPEDLSFFRNNECWMCTITHERILSISPKNEEEHKLLESMGIRFDYSPTYNISFFHEEY